MRNAVAIVGTHPATCTLAPFDDPEFDIWVFNEAAAHAWVKRADAVFQMHPPAVYRNPENRTDRNHWQWLQQNYDYPIYMQDRDPQVPGSQRYPLTEICRELLGGFAWADGAQIRFFTSSIAYAIALAIYYAYDCIDLYGTEMASGTEWQYQRDCVAFWTGLALGRGIKVTQHCGAGIYDVLLYGYDGEIGLPPDYFSRGIAQLKAAAEDAREKREQAATVDNRMMVTVDAEFSKARESLLTWASEHGMTDGLLEEALRYHHKAQVMNTANGMAPFSRQEFETNAGKARGDAEKFRAYLNHEGGRVDYVWQAWSLTKNPAALEQLRYYSQKQIELAYQAGLAEGKSQANREYMHEVDRRQLMAGGERARAAVLAPLSQAIPAQAV